MKTKMSYCLVTRWEPSVPLLPSVPLPLLVRPSLLSSSPIVFPEVRNGTFLPEVTSLSSQHRTGHAEDVQ